ncbi:MAG: hypothetical protein JW395_2632 [Nitrospira sp.]|nr:hypothetical protein [Nitrospira sp.]
MQSRRDVTGGRHAGEHQLLVHLVVNVGHVDVWQQQRGRRLGHVDRGRATGAVALAGVRQLAVGAFKVVHGQPELLQVVLALGPSGGLTGLLDSRQQQRDQHCDDGDHHQQFDECEPPSSRSRTSHSELGHKYFLLSEPKNTRH